MVVFISNPIVQRETAGRCPVVLQVSVQSILCKVSMGRAEERLRVEISVATGECRKSREHEKTVTPVENLSPESDSVNSCSCLEEVTFTLQHCAFFELQVGFESTIVSRERSSEECNAGNEDSRTGGCVGSLARAALREFKAELVEQTG